MIDKKQKMIDAFIEKDDILEKDSVLMRRANEAEEKIVELQEEAEKIEKLRNKMLKYIVYKKRSEFEIRQKFSEEDENMVEDAIEYFNTRERRYGGVKNV